jgi:hypothetical protein
MNKILIKINKKRLKILWILNNRHLKKENIKRKFKFKNDLYICIDLKI